jgi:hypothetical protein
MQPKQDESNWAHACRVFGLDSPGVVFANEQRSNTEAPRSSTGDRSADLRGTAIVVECDRGQRSGH